MGSRLNNGQGFASVAGAVLSNSAETLSDTIRGPGECAVKQWNLAEIWEAIADAIPEAAALVEGHRRRTWARYESRAASLAAALHTAGVGYDAKVGIYGHNSCNYLEAQFAILKVRGVPVNVNYHYTDNELGYIFENADMEALFFDARFGSRVSTAFADGKLPKVRILVEMGDESGERRELGRQLEDLVADFAPLPRQDYAPDDILMLYTGGTTGLPKGVLIRQGDIADTCLNGYAARGFLRPQSVEELQSLVRQFSDEHALPTVLPACPLMHGTGLCGTIMTQNLGGSVVLLGNSSFDPDQLWSMVEREKVTDLVIAGDAFARPMLAALDRAAAAGSPVDLSSLEAIFSSGVMFSREVKQGLLTHADIVIRDMMGASEGGMGISEASRMSPPRDTARFFPSPMTKVLRDDGTEIEPGTGEVGLVAVGGPVPLGYYKDPAKTAATFRLINGHRYSIPGDYASLAADGSLILMGRGSGCINTGGEKVFPEEVENIIGTYPGVTDCIVVGTPDERFGQRIVAIVALQDSVDISLEQLRAFVKKDLAGYKAPRLLVIVEHIERRPNGKADYQWAHAAIAQAQRVDVLDQAINQ